MLKNNTTTMNEEKSYVLNVNENAALYLFRSAQWSKFFAVLGFIGSGMLILGTIFMSIIFPVFFKGMSAGPHGAGIMPSLMAGPLMFVLGVVYVIFAVVYFIVSLKLYRFAEKGVMALKTNDDELLEISFKNLNSFLKIMGIVTIIALSLYIIMMIVGFLAGFGAALFA